METLGEKIYRQRKIKGYSQDELAERIGVSRQAISKWETDSMQPTLENVKLLCSALEIDISYFIDEGPKNVVRSNELAVSVPTDSFKTIKKEKESYIGFIVGITVVSIVFVITTIIAIIIGIAAYTSNLGDYNVVVSSDVTKEGFIIVLLLAITLFIVDLTLIIGLLHKKFKCKEKLTECKE